MTTCVAAAAGGTISWTGMGGRGGWLCATSAPVSLGLGHLTGHSVYMFLLCGLEHVLGGVLEALE